jgi:hypothetical protein
MGTNLISTLQLALLLITASLVNGAFAQPVDVHGKDSSSSIITVPASSLKPDSALAPQSKEVSAKGGAIAPLNSGVMVEEDFLGDDFFIAPGEENLLGNSHKEVIRSDAPKQNISNGPLSPAQPLHMDSATVPQATPVEPIDAPEFQVPVDEPVAMPSAVVEDVRSINFAQNLKDYRSPKLAMLLSFILPGVGQAYARNFVKTALFGATELGIVGASIAFWVQGNRKSEESLHYADSHFDTDKFATYYNEFEDSLLVWKNNNSDTVRSFLQTFYSLNHQNNSTVYLDTFRLWASNRTDDYYNQIGQNQFVHGWLDAEPTLSQIVQGYRNVAQNDTLLKLGENTYRLESKFARDSVPDSTFLLWVPDPAKAGRQILGQGYSHYQFTYNQMVSQANSSYGKGRFLLVLLLLNHIGSAMDAGLTAKRHNDELLGKQGVWHRLEFEQQWVDGGNSVVPGYAVRISF